MSDPVFQNHGLHLGVWSGRMVAETPPRRILLLYQGRSIGPAKVTPQGDGKWRIDATLPPETLSDGMHSFLLIADDGVDSAEPLPGGLTLGRMSLIAGRPLEDDLRAELDLMRAELDLLKLEFRRLATSG